MGKIREEFKLTNFGLSYKHADCFISCQWRLHPYVFLAYRIVLALYVPGFFLYCIIDSIRSGVKNTMAFLTMWTYLMLALYLASSAIVALVYKRRGMLNTEPENTNFAKDQRTARDYGIHNSMSVELSNEKSNSGTWIQNTTDNVWSEPNEASTQVLTLTEPDITVLMKITWVLGNIVQCFVPLVTVVYFTALFPLIGYTNFVDINLHGLTSVIVLIDTCLTARPVRLLHIIHPAAYGLSYIIFSLIYWGTDHSHVLYPNVLDWNHPGLTMIWVCGLAFVALPLLQLLFFALFRFRLHIYKSRHRIDFIPL